MNDDRLGDIKDKKNIKNVDNVDKTSEKQSKFVPSYVKKENCECNSKSSVKQNNTIYEKKNIDRNYQSDKNGFKPQKRKKSKLWIILIILISGVFLGYKFAFKKNVNYVKKSADYTALMDTYGFSGLYDNEKSTSTDVVKKSELVKMIIATTLNIDTMDSYVENKKNAPNVSVNSEG